LVESLAALSTELVGLEECVVVLSSMPEQQFSLVAFEVF
jgi:hypothetical protein